MPLLSWPLHPPRGFLLPPLFVSFDVLYSAGWLLLKVVGLYWPTTESDLCALLWCLDCVGHLSVHHLSSVQMGQLVRIVGVGVEIECSSLGYP